MVMGVVFEKVLVVPHGVGVGVGACAPSLFGTLRKATLRLLTLLVAASAELSPGIFFVPRSCEKLVDARRISPRKERSSLVQFRSRIKPRKLSGMARIIDGAFRDLRVIFR